MRKLLSAALFCTLATALPARAQDAASLKARYAALQGPLAHNQFQRPLYLESSENSGALKGDVYALVEQPYAVVGPALRGMDHWCDILILHLNVKSCRASTPERGDTLSLSVGRKFDRPSDDEYLLEFLYKVVTAAPGYLRVALNAEEGPMGTSDYRILLEVVELDAGRCFLHMSYSFANSIAARVAIQVYLATIARDKVGFSILGSKADGQPIYIAGTRGVVERNTMRYYLAIDAYLGSLSAPAPTQVEKRLNDWFAGIERYPRQLHELERTEYLDMKHKQVQQQARDLAAAAR